MKSSFVTRRAIIVAPYLILLLGLGLRFAMVPDARFTGDESSFYRTAQEIANGNEAPIMGPPVSGSEAHHPGASFYYLMSLPNHFGTSPLFSGLFVAFLSILGLALLVRMLQKIRGPTTALIAAWLCALSPWYVLYADRIWNSNVAPWLGIVAIYGLWRMREVDKSWWAAPAVVALMALFQFHLSAPILWAVAGIYLLVTRPRIRWGAVLVGIGVGVALYWPYLQAELASDFANTRAILSAGTGGAEAQGIRPALQSLLYLGLFSTGDIGYHFNTGYWSPYDPFTVLTEGGAWLEQLAWYGRALGAVVCFSWILAILGWARGLTSLAKGRAGWAAFFRDPIWCTLLVGGLAGAALLWWTHKPCYPHYNNLLLPFAIVPVAEVLAAGIRKAGSYQQFAVVVGILLLGIGYAKITQEYYAEVDSKVGITTTLAITEIITDRAGDRSFSVHTRGGEFNNAYAMGIVAKQTLDRPWKRTRRSRRQCIIMKKGDNPDRVARVRDQLWEVGNMWVVLRGF